MQKFVPPPCRPKKSWGQGVNILVSITVYQDVGTKFFRNNFKDCPHTFMTEISNLLVQWYWSINPYVLLRGILIKSTSKILMGCVAEQTTSSLLTVWLLLSPGWWYWNPRKVPALEFLILLPASVIACCWECEYGDLTLKTKLNLKSSCHTIRTTCNIHDTWVFLLFDFSYQVYCATHCCSLVNLW